MAAPLVTVIVPAKDAGDFIGTTLETLTRQFDDPASLKLVAVDDGSSDDTGAIMRRYAERFDHAEVLSNEHALGLATARNQGLARVEGEAFCFLDGDDWMQPGRLPALLRALRALDCDFVRTDHVTVRGGARKLVRAPFTHRGVVADPRVAILPVTDRTMVDYPYAWAGLLSTRMLETARFTDGLFTAEDRPWIWRLHLQASSFAVVDAPHVLYRRGLTDSLSKTLDRRQLDFARAFSEVLDLVETDREAERLLPKAVFSTFALSAHHLVRSRRMPYDVRRDLRSGIRSLLARVPQDAAAAALTQLDGPRRRVLARALRAAQPHPSPPDPTPAPPLRSHELLVPGAQHYAGVRPEQPVGGLG